MQLIPLAPEVPYSNAELVPQGHIVKQAPGLWLGSVTAADTEPLLTQNSLSGWRGWVSAASDSCGYNIRGFSLSSIHADDNCNSLSHHSM